MVKIIKKLSIVGLMVSFTYIFSMSDQERLKELENKIDDLRYRVIPHIKKQLLTWVPESKSIYTPKYLQLHIDKLRDLVREELILRKKLGITTGGPEDELKILNESIKNARQVVAKTNNPTWKEILNDYLEREKFLRYILGYTSAPTTQMSQAPSQTSRQLSTARYYDKEFFDKATPGKNWNFEIQNKFPGQLQIFIKSDHGELKTSTALRTTQDGKKIRIAGVNVKDGFIITAKEADKVNGQKIIIYIDSNNARETMYLTLAKNEQGNIGVYPQKGTFMGLSGKTDSGLLLDKSKNVQPKEIILQK